VASSGGSGSAGGLTMGAIIGIAIGAFVILVGVAVIVGFAIKRARANSTINNNKGHGSAFIQVVQSDGDVSMPTYAPAPAAAFESNGSTNIYGAAPSVVSQSSETMASSEYGAAPAVVTEDEMHAPSLSYHAPPSSVLSVADQ